MRFDHAAPLLAATLGDCVDAAVCAASKNKAVALTLAAAFIIYRAVFIGSVRRWSR